MAPKIQSLFATRILTGKLTGAAALQRRLLSECQSYRKQDRFGETWSRENYPGGYTSYASLNNMHHRSPAFLEFSERMLPIARRFAKLQGWDLRGLELEMTDCWINIMPAGVQHSLHLHPHSIISGAFYLATPPGSSPFKIEDPRMPLYMNAPIRQHEPLFHTIAARSGQYVLFESWLRHEVPVNRSKTPRISLSFNYSTRPIDPDLD